MERLREQGDLPDVIDRSTDLYFRFLLGTPARMGLLRDLINSIFGALEYPLLRTVTLADTEREPEVRGAKYARLDLTATDDLGRSLHIEMQRDAYTHFEKRCLYYLCRNYTRRLNVREGYGKLTPVVSISLLGFELFGGDERGLWDFALINPATGRRLMKSDDLLLIYVELEKFARPLKALRQKLKKNPGYVMTPEERALVWGGYINNESDGLALMGESLAADSVFSEVSEVEQQFWSEPENRYYQLRELMTQLDIKAIQETRLAEATDRAMAKGMARGMAKGMAKGMAEGVAKGMAEGMAEGVAKGIAEERRRLAERLLASGMAAERVAELTGLPREELPCGADTDEHR